MKTKSKLEEKKLTKAELEAREKIINNLKKNKSSLVKRYGKDAEAVMYGRATNIVKKMTKTNTQNNLKELIRKSLMQEADIEVTADRYGEEKALGQAAMMLDVLEDKLKKHDWFYMMSDDNRKYKEGTTQQIEIRKIIKQLEDIGYGEDAKTLFNQYAPDGPGGSTLKMKEGKKAFPDLTGDGKVTKADILKGRGVKLKEEYTEEVDALALTIKDPNEFEKAKQHFESNSDFYPFDINDEFRTFYFQVQDQADADSTEFYLTQELEGDTDLKGYYFSTESSPLSEDLDLGHEDNEPHMLKGDLYRIGKYAMELYQMIDGFEGKGEVDFPHWWQSKITTSMNNMVSAKHYLDFETKEPSIDSMLGVSDNEAPMMNEDEIGKADILSRDLYKLKDKIQPAFFDKIRKFINMGSLSDAEYLLNRVKGQMKEKGLAETIAKKLKESNGLKKGDTVEFEGKKYKIGSFDTEANLVYLNTMDNKPSEDSKGSYLKVHATKVKKTK
jgi:hypothetical protein